MTEHVILVPNRPLPRAIVESAEYRDLTENQQRDFSARLRYIEEISIKVREGLPHFGSTQERREFIDRIELDLMINIGVKNDATRHVSPWLIHSSWAFETNSREMAQSLGADSLLFLQGQLPSLACGFEELGTWLAQNVTLLDSLLRGFYGAEKFGSAIGHLIAVDLCLSRFLSVITAQRLNARLL